jgi:hypothetical protein
MAVKGVRRVGDRGEGGADLNVRQAREREREFEEVPEVRGQHTLEGKNKKKIG